MRALLLVAHGSRREESNQEVRELAERLRAGSGGRFAWVGHAFLELAQPSIPEAVAAAAASGAREVLVLPYFLSAGRHVVKDIPEEVATALREHPEMRIEVAPYLGAMAGVSDLLLDTAVSHSPAAG
jgi:sirohydrochlorin ferrochelatase